MTSVHDYLIPDRRPTQGLALEYPLRPTFLAQVVIPRDMTQREAKRLCEFISSLPIPANSAGERQS